MTLADDKPDALSASYDDLLSYYNQRHHKVIDRTLIKEPLELLFKATIEVSKNEQSNYHKQFEHLKGRVIYFKFFSCKHAPTYLAILSLV